MPVPRPDKTIEIERVLENIIKHDAKTRARGRRVLPEELVEALDYYVRWNLARNRGRALIELAMPMAREVVEKVREIGIQNITSRTKVEPAAASGDAPAPKKTAKKAAKTT
jgi:hypothetical protein